MDGIYLDGNRITTKEAMAAYMREIFPLPEYFGGNLDALTDCLSEITEDTEIRLTRESLSAICQNTYAYRTLTVLSQAAAENPHLTLKIVRQAGQKSGKE